MSDAPTVTVHLPIERAYQLLKDAGWTICSGRDKKGREYHSFTRPGGTHRHNGGVFGTDYVWELDDALTQALTS